MEKEYAFSNIDLCHQCGGKGIVEDLVYEGHTTTCPLCKGSGLVKIDKQITVIITPHVPRKA